MTDTKLTSIHIDLTQHQTTTHIALANITANDICASTDPKAKRANLLAFLEIAQAAETDFRILTGFAPVAQQQESAPEPEPTPEPTPEPVATPEPKPTSGFSLKKQDK